MADTHQAKAKKLKKLDIARWTATLWIVKRTLVRGAARYTVMGVDIDKELQKRLRGDVRESISKDMKLRPYEFVSEDQDGSLLSLDVNATDFEAIEVLITAGTGAPRAQAYEQLLNSWAYVVRLQHGQDVPVYGFRKISALTSTRRVKGIRNLLWQDHVLVDIEDRNIFTIASGFDFIAYDGVLLISDKKRFESALNFRVGMERIRDSVFDEFEQRNIFKNPELLRLTIGVNLSRLRRVCSVHKNGYHRDEEYMKRLMELCGERDWNVKTESSRIVVDESNVDTVLMLLDNGRLDSPVNAEEFDAIVKRKLG